MNILNNDEAELGVIGSIIIDNLCLQDLEITEEYFFNSDLKNIFSGILELKKEGIAIDLITIQDYLFKNNLLNKVGGMNYLIEIVSNTPTSANFVSYQEIVKNYYIKFNINNLLNKTKNILNNGVNITDSISNIYKGLADIETKISNNDKNISEILENTHMYIENIKTKELLGYSFGEEFKFLNIISGGLEKGKIYRIGGGSNVGKSWLMYNFLINLLEQIDKITFFALENSVEFTMKNLLCNKKGVNPRNDLIKKEMYNFSEEYNFFMSKENFNLTDKYRNLFDIFRIAVKNKSEFIFIDFIQLVEIPGNFKGETEKYNFYSKELQKFASKYNIGVIDLSQLSNDTQRNGLEGIGSTEFKGGGSLKESCDLGIHLFKDKKKEELKETAIQQGDKEEFNKSYINILISKNRLGPGVGSKHNYELDFNKGGKYIKDLFE